MRYIELYTSGEIKYFSIDKKGRKEQLKSVWLLPGDDVKLVDSKQMQIKCVKKGETHYLIEPTSKYINVRQEESEGRNCFVSDWVE